MYLILHSERSNECIGFTMMCVFLLLCLTHFLVEKLGVSAIKFHLEVYVH